MRDEIGAFGGDPANVTAVGQAASVETILAAQGTIPAGFVPPEGPWHHCVDADIVTEHPGRLDHFHPR